MKINIKKETNNSLKKIELSYNFKKIFIAILILFLPYIMLIIFSPNVRTNRYFFIEIFGFILASISILMQLNSRLYIEKNKILNQIKIKNKKSDFEAKKDLTIYQEDKPYLLANKISNIRYDLVLIGNCFKFKNQFSTKLLPNIAYYSKDLTKNLFLTKNEAIEIADFLELKIKFKE